MRRPHPPARFAPLRLSPSVLAVVVLLVLAHPASAQTYYWNAPAGGPGTWDASSANWNTDPTGAAAPVAWLNDGTVTAGFGGTGDAVALSGTINAFGLTFTAGGYTLSGGTALNLTGAGGVIDTGGFDATISSAITGGVGLTKNGAGTLTLSGANTYTGVTTVSAGVLAVTTAGALGGAADGTVVASGAALQVSGLITLAEPLTLNSDGIAAGGSLWKVGNNTTTLTGGVTLASAARINADAGTLTISTVGISGTDVDLTVGGAGNTTISAAIATGNGGLIKDGAGTLTLSGANTYAGLTSVNAGVVAVSSAAGLGTTAGGTTVAAGAALQVSGTVTIAEPLTLNSDGIGGAGALRKTANNTTTLSGPISLASAARINADAGTLTITGGITGTDQNLTVGGAGNVTINTAGIGTGAGTLTKDGTGTLTLSIASTYTGVTTINSGVVAVSNATGLGTAAGGTTVTGAGAALQVSGAITVAEPLTLNGDGIGGAGALRKTANNATTWSGAITLGTGGARINSDANTLTVSGGISGAAQPLTVGGVGNTSITGAITTGAGGTIVKDGTGTLTLSNAGNNFAAVSSGSVVISINQGTVSQPGEATSTAGANTPSGVIPTTAIGAVPSYVLINGGTLTSTRAGVGVTFLATNKGITLGSNGGTLAVTDTASGDLNIYSGVITGSGSLTYAGPGVLSLTAVQTYTGSTTVTGGTLRVRTTPERFPDSTALTVMSGAIFDLNGLNETVGSVQGAGTVNLGSATFASGGTNASTVFSGQFVQTAGGIGGKVTKTGTGTLTLTGNNVYSGVTTVSGGTLQVGNPTALGFGGAATAAAGTTVSAGATLDLNGTAGVNETITISGTGVGGNGVLINSNTAAAAVIASGVASSSFPTTAGAATTVTASGGGGTGATATASLGLTAASFTINSGTTTYSVAPTVVVSGNGVATAVLNGSGLVTGVTITTVGSGYTTAPTITFSGGTVSNPGTDPTGTGNTSNFRIVNIAMTNPGSGYTSPPTFTSGSVSFTPVLSGVVLSAAASAGGPGDVTINGVVSGAAAAPLTKVGAGALTLAGANTFAGGTALTAGNLNINFGGTGPTNSALGTGTLTITGGAIDNTSGAAVVVGTNNAQAWNADFTFGGTNPLDLGTGAVTLGGAGTARAVTANGAAPLAVGGVVSGPLGFTKLGPGTVAFGGANTYTGPTTISAGTLRVNGDTSGATGPVAVAAAATLGGTGTVGGAVSVAGGGTVAPGNGGIGTMSAVAGVALAPNANLAIKLGANGPNPGVTPGTADQLAVTGAAGTLDFATGSVLKLSPDAVSVFDRTQPAIYTVGTVAAAGNITLDGGAGGPAPTTFGSLVFSSATPSATGSGPVKIDVTAFAGLQDGDTFTLTQTGSAAVLTYAPAVVPEPVSVGLAVAVGLGGLTALRRVRPRPASA
jgi:autotransporter-associated beta strand protein